MGVAALTPVLKHSCGVTLFEFGFEQVVMASPQGAWPIGSDSSGIVLGSLLARSAERDA